MQAWDEKCKTNFCTQISGCGGMIALVDKETAKADGHRWEVPCAKEEKA